MDHRLLFWGEGLNVLIQMYNTLYSACGGVFNSVLSPIQGGEDIITLKPNKFDIADVLRKLLRQEFKDFCGWLMAGGQGIVGIALSHNTCAGTANVEGNGVGMGTRCCCSCCCHCC